MKCGHDKCINEAEQGSPYCKDCIHLPTKECNYCNIGDAEPSEERKLADAIAATDKRIHEEEVVGVNERQKPTPVWLALVMVYFFILGGVAIGAILAKSLEYLGLGWRFIEGGVIGGIVGLGAGIHEMNKRGWL